MRAIKSDFRQAHLDAATRTMLEFADKSTRTPSAMTPADLDGLRACGFSDEDLLDIVHVTAYFNYINRVADSLGVDGEPDFDPMQQICPERYRTLRKFERML